MSKTLYELGVEYEENVRQLQKTAAGVRIELKEAERNFDKDRIYFLSRKLYVLYEEIMDMKIIAEKLKNYYEEKEAVA